jgi:hypothetical protein
MKTRIFLLLPCLALGFGIQVGAKQASLQHELESHGIRAVFPGEPGYVNASETCTLSCPMKYPLH